MTKRSAKWKASHFFIVATVYVLVGGAALAEEAGGARETSPELEMAGRYMPMRSEKLGGGKVEMFQSDVTCSQDFRLNGKLPVTASVHIRNMQINSTTKQSLPSQLNGVTADVETSLPLGDGDKAGILWGASPSFFSDGWTFTKGAFRLPLRTAFFYKQTSRLAFFAGVAVYPRFRERICPVLGFNYQPTKALEFDINTEASSITYQMNERWSIFVEGEGTYDEEYLVRREGSGTSILKYKEFLAGPGLKYQFNKFLDVSLSAGRAWGRSFKYLDSPEEIRLKPDMYINFKVTVAL